MAGAIKVLFEGKKHKITTDGKAFFLYAADNGKWQLRDSNSLSGTLYGEALDGMKSLLSDSMSEEDKIMKLMQNGFFSVSNL